MGCEQRFGGDWTIEKLDILSSYLDAYLIALKKQKFKKIYIDAFAGTGSITTKDGEATIAGSTKIALMAKEKFDRYYFIEADKEKAQELENMVSTEFQQLRSKITICKGDANTKLSKICNRIDWRYNRALLFLDPYATQVSWSLLETIAKTKAIDVWYLFPFQALQRMLRNDGKMDTSWVDCINRLLGDSSWTSEFYKENPQISFFETQELIKDVDTEGLIQYILKRLHTIFPVVADNPRIFRNSKMSPIFLFCFAISSESPAAQRLAKSIANHILR